MEYSEFFIRSVEPVGLLGALVALIGGRLGLIVGYVVEPGAPLVPVPERPSKFLFEPRRRGASRTTKARGLRWEYSRSSHRRFAAKSRYIDARRSSSTGEH